MKTMLLFFSLAISTAAVADDKAPKAAADDTTGKTGEANAAAGVDGQETVCKQDSRVRKVTLSKGQDKTACKVSYLKESDAPGEAKVLWSSKQQADYCQKHAVDFVEKLKGMGWSCQ